MKFVNFFQLLAALCYFTNLAAEDPKYAALIFNQKFKKLEEIKHDDEGCYDCLTACPASSEVETKFIENDTITKDGLFVADAYLYGNNEKKLRIQICDKPFKPVTVSDMRTKSHEIGYELYYKENQIGYVLKCDKYDHLRNIIDGRPNMKRRLHRNRVRKYTDGNNTVFELQDSNEKLIFYWISVLTIETSIPVLLPPEECNNRQITFEKDAMLSFKPHETIAECKDYNFGEGWQTASANENESSTSESGQPSSPCEKSDECLEMTQIIPIMYFHTVASRLATCSYLNIANISRPIAKGQLKKIDLYLYAMYRIWDANDIQIIFGITGELNFAEGEINSYEAERNLSKDPTTRKFPTPELMYRILKYTVKDTLYQTIIVIHNNFNATPVKRICSKEEEVTGWHKIKIQDTDKNIGLSYACPVTLETMNQLAIRKTAGILPSKALALNTFPKYNDETGDIDEYDTTKLIDDEIKYLTEDLQIVH